MKVISKDEVINRLNSIKRRDIDYYKATPKKTTLIHSPYSEGRFILWSDIKLFMDELKADI